MKYMKQEKGVPAWDLPLAAFMIFTAVFVLVLFFLFFKAPVATGM